MTIAFSHLSRLKRDHRFGYGAHREGRRSVRIADDLDSYVWFTPFHPLNWLPPALARLADPVFRRYDRLKLPGVADFVQRAELVIMESAPGLMLLEQFRSWNSRARYVYRVSDDLELLHAHQVVRAAETRALPLFDLVSVPSAALLEKMAGTNPNVRLHPHGIEKRLFDVDSPTPYGSSSRNAVFVGTSHFDSTFVEIAATEFPQWQFHVVGAVGDVPARPNVHRWGELPFSETIPFITHAQLGLACRTWAPNASVLSDSLKVIQYSYARLPILAPTFLGATRPNVILYPPGDRAGILQAFDTAIRFDRSTISREGILSWDEVARGLVGAEE